MSAQKEMKFVKRNKLYERLLAFILMAGCVFMLSIDYGVSHDAWWTFLTFTFISNAVAAVTYQLRAFDVVDRSRYFQKVWQTAVTSMLFLAFAVYWSLLAATAGIWTNPPVATSSIWVHLINPLLVVALYIWQAFRLKGHKITFWHFSLALAIPTTWLVMQQSMSYGAGIHFYTILDPSLHSYGVIYMYITIMTVAAAIISIVFVVLNNYIRDQFHVR